MEHSTEAQLSLFAGDTRASHSPRPGSEEARKMTATSGQKCIAYYRKSDPVGSLVKMLLGTSRWGSTRCYLTWRAQATPHSRLLFRLSPSMPPIAETGFGLWPTPKASDWKGSVTAERAAESTRGVDLPEEVTRRSLWPSPMRSDGEEYSSNMEYFKKRVKVAPMLPVIVGLTWEETPEGMLGKLNPQWVEWLMGFPPGWTDLDV